LPPQIHPKLNKLKISKIFAVTFGQRTNVGLVCLKIEQKKGVRNECKDLGIFEHPHIPSRGVPEKARWILTNDDIK
jgi:hypothetical protein